MSDGNISARCLSNAEFWEWMAQPSTAMGEGLQWYVERIARCIAETGYILERFNEHSFGPPSAIMEKLSLCMPRDYFLEVQYCASTYAAFFGKVFPPLARRVDELAYIEWLMYMEPDYLRYRDHLVHMFKVAFVGDQLLSIQEHLLSEIVEQQFRSSHFLEWCGKRSIAVSEWEEVDRNDIVRIAFFMASLFHDFGYGYFFLLKYRERLFKLYRWLLPGADLADIHASAAQMFEESLPAHFVYAYHGWLRSQKPSNVFLRNVAAGFFRDCLPLNHSIASMFFVLDVAERLSEMGALTQKMYVAFQLAAEACMIHDMSGKSGWMHLHCRADNGHEHFLSCDDHQNIPLAMLLILADELSIWERYSLEPQVEKDRVIYSLGRGKEPESIDVTIDTRETREMKIAASPIHIQGLLQKKFESLGPFKTTADDGDRFILDYRIVIP